MDLDTRARHFCRPNNTHKTGSKLKITTGPCERCGGKGYILERFGGGGPSVEDYYYDEDEVRCPTCAGTGKVRTFERIKK